jgi:hypothetical protein
MYYFDEFQAYLSTFTVQTLSRKCDSDSAGQQIREDSFTYT